MVLIEIILISLSYNQKTVNHLNTFTVLTTMSSLTKKLERHVDINSVTQDVFTDLNSKRIVWNVPHIAAEDFKIIIPGLERCFSRVISIGLELELPVGSFIRAALEKISDIPPTAVKGMIDNIVDEEKHYATFEKISRQYKIFPEDKAQAVVYRKRAVQNKLNPIAKTRDLETIVFLVLQGVMRVYGGQNLERVIADISHDELRHTNYGWELSCLLSIDRYPNFENFCTSVVNWCIEPLETKELWQTIAEEIKEEGQSVKLTEMLNYGIHRAPFEISNANY